MVRFNDGVWVFLGGCFFGRFVMIVFLLEFIIIIFMKVASGMVRAVEALVISLGGLALGVFWMC